MKVQSTPTFVPVEAMARPSARTSAGAVESSVKPESVTVTGGAKFVSDVRGASASFSLVLADEVARAKADIANGRLMSDVEIDAAVDGLLAGL